MIYAKVVEGQVLQVGEPARRVKIDGQWVDIKNAEMTLLANLGWYPVQPTPKPPDTLANTHDQGYELIDGVPTEMWTERPWTQKELDEKNFVEPKDQIASIIQLTIEEHVAKAEYRLWRQPTGAHDAYPPGWIVLDALGDRWRNDLGTWNAHPLDEIHARWTNLDLPEATPGTVEPWVVWSGFNEDLYQVGDFVTHSGSTWESTVSNNHWEPGVFGWVEVVV